MSNRSRHRPGQRFPAPRFEACLREVSRDLPDIAFDCTAWDLGAALSGRSGVLDARLGALRAWLCDSQTRAEESQALWRESVLTAAHAWRVAPDLGGEPRIAGLAGLLLRLGDLLALRALAQAEFQTQTRLGAGAKADWCASKGAGLIERAVQTWGIPPQAAAAAMEWRHAGDFQDASVEVRAVHLGRLLSIERLAPRFCPPGLVESAATEAGLARRRLSALRGDATIAALFDQLK